MYDMYDKYRDLSKRNKCLAMKENLEVASLATVKFSFGLFGFFMDPNEGSR